MKERTRKIFIMIVMAALIVSLMAASFAALTYGRYSGGRRDENSAYEDILDLVGETAFEVSTADELVNAINNGYSYIKVVGDDPTLVVNNNVADVVVNLVLDVNGHKIVRNSRNPLLNVRQSVSVVLVYDSSEKAEGGFYNPVGSALQTSGGTLTVGEGVYESGPSSEATQSQGEGTVSATVCSRDNNRKATSYSVQSTDQTFPKLTKKTGDVYLTADTSNSYLKADTYLIYTEEENAFVEDGTSAGDGTVLDKEQLYVNAKKDDNGTVTSADKFSPICDVASCDFYYYYPVGAPGTANSPQTYAVVYGYNDVKKLASNEKDAAKNLQDDGLVWPYAAIRSEAGNTHARGGEFYTYFGEENTYSIYSEGGTMTVGLSGESDPPKFQAIGKGVCINMAGTSGSADQTLTIENGEFSSQLGNTIEMSGGEMEVKKGSFTKTDCKKGTGDKQLENQTAIISLTGGTLNVSGTKTGDDTYSVTMTAGSAVTNPDGTVTYSGTLQNVFGIRAEGGTVTTSGCTFNISGDYSAGVLSYNGTINLDDNTVINVTQSETATVLTSAGVSSEQASEDGEHPVKLSGDVTITSNGLGITARGAVNVTEGESTVTTSRGTGIYVNNGSFTVDSMAEITVNSTVKSGYSWATPPGTGSTNPPNIFNGVYVQGGSLVSNGTLNVTFTGVQNDARNAKGDDQIAYNGENTSFLNQQTKSYAVRVEAGTGTTTVTIASGEIKNTVGGGVLVNGGTVHLGGYVDENGTAHTSQNPVTVQTTGTEVDNTSRIHINGMADNWDYYWNMKGGDAVKVDGGELAVYDGTYKAAQGNGILTRGGTANIYDGIFTGGYNSTYHATTGAASTYSFKAYGGTVNISGGDFVSAAEGAFVMGTSASDKVTITGGNFRAQGPTAFATWNGATVEFDDTNSEIENKITVSGESTGLTVEQVSSGWSSQNITIKSATFESTNQNESNKNGIWYGNGNAKLTISGGSFTGSTGSGLRIDASPGNNIQLSGGTYRGGNNAWYGNSPSNITTGEILTSNAWLYDKGSNPIVYASRSNMNWTYSHLGGNGTSVALNGALSVTAIGGRDDPLSNYKYITITANRVTDSNALENAADNRNFG